MAPEKAPAFQFYVKDWRSSRSIMRMSFAQRGMYLEMLLEQWESGSLPDDPIAVAELIGGAPSEWRRAWPCLRRKFMTLADGSIQNAKLEEVRSSRKTFARTKSENGRKGAEVRWQSHSKDIAQPSIVHSKPIAPDSSSSAIATASSFATATAVRIGGGRPLPGFKRLRIFRWMVEDLIAALGDYAEAFDLDAFFQSVDEDGSRVFPETWPWIKTEVLAEARRRGLPVAESAHLGKQTTNLMSAVAGLSDRR